ncbi:hypothetical protein Dda3937_04578 [Dickeya dadantii 3937]|jgi:hypothetical protein|uniref:Uncharacterized protein n=1 Tax=Dickeya dadantii (strain 3937) TaxID=198628 RepID=E0SBD9_DICD3|nr:hypothetical protein Dda3937_04578 [Dickeya dadantii 3937]
MVSALKFSEKDHKKPANNGVFCLHRSKTDNDSRFCRQIAGNFRNQIEKPRLLLLNQAIAFIRSALSQWIITAAKLSGASTVIYTAYLPG